MKRDGHLKTLWKAYPEFIPVTEPGQGYWTYTRFGPTISPGWAGIYEDVLRSLRQLGYQGVVLQCKEKFGLLRIYIAGDSERAWAASAIVRQAEQDSRYCCDNCGNISYQYDYDEETHERIKPTYYRDDLSWIRTLCGYCYLSRKTFGNIL